MELLTPERVERMAQEMRALVAARIRQQAETAETMPAELQALDERIGRLRERQEAGDPDLETDEIEAAIKWAELKRQELVDMQPAAKQCTKLLAMLPRAAETYRRQIVQGLDNDPRAANKARALLRKLLGTIRLRPGPDKSLWAEFENAPCRPVSTSKRGRRRDDW